MLKQLFRKKLLVHDSPQPIIKRYLTGLDLVFMGIGITVGAGLFTLTGIAAALHAGPAIVLSYLLAGITGLLTALCYIEFAGNIGGSGSAYSYAYVGLGEMIAWIIGWDLILEYGISICAVAIGWSGYINDLLMSFGLVLPKSIILSYKEGGWVNFPAMLIVLGLSCVVASGVKQTARVNSIIVCIKLTTVAIFILIACKHIKIDYWRPFMPFGWTGVTSGAALVFFSYIGFDAVTTASEEAITPKHDLIFGIVGSILICIIVYIIVAALLTGIAPYQTLNVGFPIAISILRTGHPWIANLIAIGVITGLTSVILLLIYGLSRISFSVTRDGLLPKWCGKIHPVTGTPVVFISVIGVILSIISGYVPMAEMVELINIGTLATFTIICFGVIVFRYRYRSKSAKTSFSTFIPILGILSCLYLMKSLSQEAWLRFLVWMFLGIVVYALYGYHHSNLAVKIRSKTFNGDNDG